MLAEEHLHRGGNEAIVEVWRELCFGEVRGFVIYEGCYPVVMIWGAAGDIKSFD